MISRFQQIATHDGTFLVHDPETGLTASARALDEAIAELRRLLVGRPAA